VCCGEGERLDLPPAVVEALAGYRRLLGERGFDWGDDRIDLFRMARFALLADVYLAYAATGDWAAAIRSQVADGVPRGTVLVRAGGDPAVSAGPPRLAVPGRPVPVDVVVDAAGAATDPVVTLAGRAVPVAAGGAVVEILDLDAPGFDVVVDGRTLRAEGAVDVVPAARLRLRSPLCARWSVTDATGGGWFPDGSLRKWTVHGEPFFHGHDVELEVPAGPLRVVCARGLEFGRVERAVSPVAGESAVVECDPPRLFDPVADGWYGGDLHVHQNYSGDQVCSPADAARMQLGEGLHLLNLTAGNATTSLVYDREQLEEFGAADLPWSGPGVVARMGVEYRNDLLGHVHALGPAAPPERWYAGHARSDHPEHWPANAVACEELRALGATVGYAHPSATDLSGDVAAFLAVPESVEARELVADAALGLVDSVDLVSPFDDEGAIVLYHRLLSCGLRLAATAGTDCFLSFARLGVASNPPGWGRVYAHLGGEPLSVPAFQDAVRAGRTVVTNGPWLTLTVDGQGPGAVLDRRPGEELAVVARVTGPGAERLAVVGPDGVVAEIRCDAAGHAELRADVPVEGPTWLAAVSRGGADPHTLDASVLAHTSAVYVDVAGRRVARAEAARWCLALLDGVEGLVRRHGRFDEPAHLDEVVDVLDRARAFYRELTARPGG
jgi:hypothetical protein